ncbi:MAG: nucleotide pyrophosphohydrolase [Planctomycetes bacterium]|nr:nucleotide pyrophosphohydrolase [Planctomycetota bacterium]
MTTPEVSDRFQKVRDAMLAFRDAREWKPFHDPKNLAEGLAIEAGELLEVFLWKTTEECRCMPSDPVAITKIREELADCFLFCVLMADACKIDLIDAAHEKIEVNARKYPVERAKGRRDKYDAL